MNRRDNFIEYLQGIQNRNDRAALADLRRGLGDEPGAAQEMAKYIYPFFDKRDDREEFGFFLVASLFALHPETAPASKDNPNLGAHLRLMAKGDEDELKRLERRFTQLLAAERSDLPELLPRAISLLKATGEPVNWRQLLNDVIVWNDYTRKDWARGFWNRPDSRNPDLSTGTNPETILTQEGE